MVYLDITKPSSWKPNLLYRAVLFAKNSFNVARVKAAGALMPATAAAGTLVKSRFSVAASYAMFREQLLCTTVLVYVFANLCALEW